MGSSRISHLTQLLDVILGNKVSGLWVNGELARYEKEISGADGLGKGSNRGRSLGRRDRLQGFSYMPNALLQFASIV
jgi:hypothetical protein